MIMIMMLIIIIIMMIMTPVLVPLFPLPLPVWSLAARGERSSKRAVSLEEWIVGSQGMGVLGTKAVPRNGGRR